MIYAMVVECQSLMLIKPLRTMLKEYLALIVIASKLKNKKARYRSRQKQIDLS